jgi:cytochrome c-type biogenesis protein
MDMELASLGVAFTAGMLAVLAPCALPMLPSYVAYYMNLDEDERSLGASLGFAFTVVTGFLVVFLVIGLLPSFALNQVSSRLEYVAPFIGALLVLIGLASGLSDVFDRMPAVNVSAPRRTGYRSFFLYGVGYGAASLACSLPVFILLVLQSSTAGGPLGVFSTFLVYGLGASAVIVPLTLALTYSKDYVHQRLVWLLPRIKKINAAVLILVGLYMIISYFI